MCAAALDKILGGGKNRSVKLGLSEVALPGAREAAEKSVFEPIAATGNVPGALARGKSNGKSRDKSQCGGSSLRSE